MLKVESLTIEEIKKKYPDEWVLIEYEEVDSEFNVIKGHVIAHSPVKEEIYKILMETKGKNIVIEYTGRIPEDLAVMFFMF
ncbi:MAG: hypothetical protein IBX72_12040 [Nitrospirae bacterium]|nr:hypothetical protein [Nitrospirota bacterium]